MGLIAILRCLKGAAELVVVSADDETDPPLTVAAERVKFGLRAPSCPSVAPPTRNLPSVIGLWFGVRGPRIVGTLTCLTRWPR